MNQNDKSVKCENSEEEECEMVERELAEDAQWKRIQQNTFTRWANEHLKAINKNIDDLECDLSDGLKLVGLIEVLSQKRLPKHNQRPTFRSQKLENVSVALKFLEDEGIRIVSIDSREGSSNTKRCKIRDQSSARIPPPLARNNLVESSNFYDFNCESFLLS